MDECDKLQTAWCKWMDSPQCHAHTLRSIFVGSESTATWFHIFVPSLEMARRMRVAIEYTTLYGAASEHDTVQRMKEALEGSAARVVSKLISAEYMESRYGQPFVRAIQQRSTDSMIVGLSVMLEDRQRVDWAVQLSSSFKCPCIHEPPVPWTREHLFQKLTDIRRHLLESLQHIHVARASSSSSPCPRHPRIRDEKTPSCLHCRLHWNCVGCWKSICGEKPRSVHSKHIHTIHIHYCETIHLLKRVSVLLSSDSPCSDFTAAQARFLFYWVKFTLESI